MKTDCLTKIDEYAWIRRIMLSCETKKQNKVAYKFVNLFYRKYKDVFYTMGLIDLSVEIDDKLKKKSIKI